MVRKERKVAIRKAAHSRIISLSNEIRFDHKKLHSSAPIEGKVTKVNKYNMPKLRKCLGPAKTKDFGLLLQDVLSEILGGCLEGISNDISSVFVFASLRKEGGNNVSDSSSRPGDSEERLT